MGEAHEVQGLPMGQLEVSTVGAFSAVCSQASSMESIAQLVGSVSV